MCVVDENSRVGAGFVRAKPDDKFLFFRISELRYSWLMSDYVSIQARGTVSLPVALRRRYGLDEPGAQVEIIDADGEIILRPKIAVDVSQAWFWSEDWQAGESEANKQHEGGKGRLVESGEEFLDSLADGE
jgi:antitoxin MazE